ncbi:NAD-dependent epimerase/dehydratase family protein [Nocardia panacis]|uniref:Carboxylic acid reductase n=1 Tax=Nocardia panacis TaxID=2340916 RepID=A0A3A4K4S5_9NOCA|nr:NAD-dependent epimerase/dehydratase family protein [Nocardia panacis]
MYAEDEQVRAAAPDAAIAARVREPGIGLPRIVTTILQGYADRPAIGQRATEITVEDTGRKTVRRLPRFDTVTYGELAERVAAVAAAWAGEEDNPLRQGDFVATLGFISGDYAAIDLACLRTGAVAVPLQAGATRAQQGAILAETEPLLFASSAELLDTAVELVLAAPVTPHHLVVFDYHPGDDKHRAALESARERLAGRVVVEPLTEVLDRGRTLPPAPELSGDDDALALLIYTSGSTGAPKGAMYTQRHVARIWLGMRQLPVINFNFMPLGHVAGRISLYATLARGGTAYFAAESDMSTLFEDLALIHPTELFFVPRVCDMVFQRYQSEVDRRTTAGADPAVLDREVKDELRHEILGDRLIYALVGSAPLAPEMRAFTRSLLGIPLHDGYGSTEAGGGVLLDNRIQRDSVLDYKLIDVPELGYFATDKPYPRGELLLKTNTMIPGYYRRPEVTAEIFDADGFYKTGDIMAETGPDELIYVDRRNNVLKLSQGEFVAVAHLESVYASSPLVRQIFLYGSSERSYLLAVIVPTADALAAHGDSIKSALGDSLQRIGKDAQLQSYEIPRDFLIETEPFSEENGLLSGIGKILRPKLRDHYGPRLQQLYADLAAEQTNELLELRRTAAGLPVLEVVGRAAGALLGCAGADLRPDAHFTDLGGDSLSALSYSTLLRDILGVEVPVGVIVSPANDLTSLAKYIEAERDSSAGRPTAASVHASATEIRAAELTLDKFLDERTLAAASTLPAATGTPRTVLLTGANGYLGRFLCLEWLQRLAPVGGKLVCVIRGSDPAAARARLDAAFDSGDPELLRHYTELARDTLEVLPGDIGDPDLGLDQANWRRLAETVDLIVHPAALVNHVLPYGQLFGPNVVGTAEVIRLAITARRKPVTYLSTVGVASGMAPGEFDEDGDIRRTSPQRRIDDGYANGYGNSKWAGEVLLREAHDRCGLPVAVFRSDMILAHSRYAGQLNLPDMFTRLILSLLTTGVAPYSFYRTDAAGERERGHYDGLPADFTAAAITELGVRVTDGYRTYDVFNPHDDGVSLDLFVDWLIEAGHPIRRLDDYGQWFARFETSLRALPDKQRQASVLPLLHAYREPEPAVRGSAFPTERFHEAVREAKIGPDHDIPHLSRALIDKYVSDLRLRGLL